jgi:hypothetical protein
MDRQTDGRTDGWTDRKTDSKQTERGREREVAKYITKPRIAKFSVAAMYRMFYLKSKSSWYRLQISSQI